MGITSPRRLLLLRFGRSSDFVLLGLSLPILIEINTVALVIQAVFSRLTAAGLLPTFTAFPLSAQLASKSTAKLLIFFDMERFLTKNTFDLEGGHKVFVKDYYIGNEVIQQLILA